MSGVCSIMIACDNDIVLLSQHTICPSGLTSTALFFLLLFSCSYAWYAKMYISQSEVVILGIYLSSPLGILHPIQGPSCVSLTGNYRDCWFYCVNHFKSFQGAYAQVVQNVPGKNESQPVHFAIIHLVHQLACYE